jgi:predicted protein tyrosine phosphatase
MIYVCSLNHLPATVEMTGARHVVTVMGKLDRVTRPAAIAPDNHLMIAMDDVTEAAEGFAAPRGDHVERIIGFVRRWDRAAPLVIHCFAGISRSTASAFTAACAINPRRDEAEIAWRMRAASPTAAPNRLIVQLADGLLGRNGRMLAALDAIGPPVMAIEGEPFRVDLD